MLPSATSQFAEASYWDRFFEERKKQAGKKASGAFEWYGVFKDDLLQLVRRYHRATDRALVLGCGNSSLSEDLLESKCAGNVVSVDFSQTAIDEMVLKTRSEPRLSWVLGDVTKLPVDYSDSFDVVWDKGALDAILGDADGDESSLETGRLMLMETLRCLKPGARYFCVSLLQDHVLRTILDSFINSAGFESLHLTSFSPKADSVLCPFLLVLTKPTDQTRMFSQLHLSLESADAVARDLLVQHVHTSQKAYAARRELSSVKSGARGTFSLMSPVAPSRERFKLSIVDTNKSKIPFACLILPQGREHEWTFSSEEGQLQMATSNEIGRLVIVCLGRGETFTEGTEGVQRELNSNILDFAPANLPKAFKIPYLAVAHDLGRRTTVFEGESSVSGKYFVEDVELDGEVFRRLIFENNPLAIQSEAKVLKGQSQVDVAHLCFDFHQVMLGFSKAAIDASDVKRATVCGLGAGSLFMALSQVFPSALLEGVDIDAEVVQAARRFFGLSTVNDEPIHVQDALVYLKGIREDAKLDLVLLDINGADESTGLRFPPLPFIERSFLENLKEHVLSPKHGVALINFGCRTDALTRTLLADAARAFEGHVLVADMSDLSGDLNMILCLSQRDVLAEERRKIMLDTLAASYQDLTTALKLVSADGSLLPLVSSASADTAGLKAKSGKNKKKKKKH